MAAGGVAAVAAAAGAGAGVVATAAAVEAAVAGAGVTCAYSGPETNYMYNVLEVLEMGEIDL